MTVSLKVLLMSGALIALFFEARADGVEFQLKQSTNLDVVEENCGACHSLDYIEMNSPFLDEKGWQASVSKMVKAFGAPIEAADQQKIVEYLTAHYGKK